jgi:outer membrane autotransporter protein
VNGRINIVEGEQNFAERGSDGFGGGVTVGVDNLVSDDLFAGAAFGYTHINTKYDGTGSDAKLNALTFSGYGSFFPTDSTFVDGSISVSWLGFDQSNELLVVDAGAPLPTLSGDANGANFGFDIGGGWAFAVAERIADERAEGLVIEPNARLSFLYTYIEDYELGGGDHSLDLRIDEQETTSLTATVGFRTEYPVSTRYGVLTPYFRAHYVHEFLNENDDLDIGLAVVGGPTAKLKAEATDSHYANVGLGVTATLGQGLSQFVDYDVIAAHENVTIHQITAGIRLEF